MCFSLFFFFSSRRRHTRSLCDWSSDVCSSDLAATSVAAPGHLWRDRHTLIAGTVPRTRLGWTRRLGSHGAADRASREDRSEERRVGKECRFRETPSHEKKEL